jgi:hypothetical protein
MIVRLRLRYYLTTGSLETGAHRRDLSWPLLRKEYVHVERDRFWAECGMSKS